MGNFLISSRKEQHPYDRQLYKLYHLVENAFSHLKWWQELPFDIPKEPLFLVAVQFIIFMNANI